MTELADISIFSFVLSVSSLYGAGVFLDAVLISGLDDLEKKINTHWRRLATGLSLFFISFLIVVIDQTWKRNEFQSLAEQATDSFSKWDLVLLFSVAITWILSIVLSIFALFIDRAIQASRTAKRLNQFASRR